MSSSPVATKAQVLQCLASLTEEQLQAAGAKAAEQSQIRGEGIESPYTTHFTASLAQHAKIALVKQVLEQDQGSKQRRADLGEKMRDAAPFGEDVAQEDFETFDDAQQRLRAALEGLGVKEAYLAAEFEAQGPAAVARYVHVFLHHLWKVRSSVWDSTGRQTYPEVIA